MRNKVVKKNAYYLSVRNKVVKTTEFLGNNQLCLPLSFVWYLGLSPVENIGNILIHFMGMTHHDVVRSMWDTLLFDVTKNRAKLEYIILVFIFQMHSNFWKWEKLNFNLRYKYFSYSCKWTELNKLLQNKAK